MQKYYRKELSLLVTIPGVSEKFVTLIIAESRADMQAFAQSNIFVSWVGFSPRNDESAGKFKLPIDDE